ncbi:MULTISPECIES: glycosyltransferase [unclassified Nodularia (in: cyanobacteria)]|uniref:glycosyltransferase n=1 Tax=unclassified Nodularia (in: cyanobacteria) TaxID=2656917 RepID=UPI0018816EF8|nr:MULTISPECIES: glycosyltransferase [unclassified Nodularia (in: cyanobacteria)]MBE9199412.1 glycosyltransferase [Nodularia sp. LEGE 06071]MCC2692910.1 glycosyltransferase [Nodularia sp. LEGE 04288]
MSSSCTIKHFSTELSGGSGIAAQRLHKALLEKSISSELLFRKGSTSLPHSISDRRNSSLPWRDLDSITISKEWNRSVNDRSLFTNPQWIYKTQLKDFGKLPEIINLHWISRWIDQPSFFDSIPPDIPIVWSLHDMNPITGGCHHALDCEKFATHCCDCPNLKNSGKHDQASKNFALKAKLYQHLNLHFVGNSTWTTLQAQKSQLGKYARSIRTIPLGIDIKDYQPIDRSIAKAALRVNPDDLAIAFACADLSDKNKNLPILLEAIAQLSKHHSITLILFGSGQIPELNSQITTVILGHLSSPQLQSLAYSAADIFVMPSQIESFGLTALESMACGTPVLAFRTGGIPDLVIHGETGWLADDIGSIESLYEGLHWMLQHPQERSHLGKAARQRVEREFTDDIMANRYINLYQELISP